MNQPPGGGGYGGPPGNGWGRPPTYGPVGPPAGSYGANPAAPGVPPGPYAQPAPPPASPPQQSWGTADGYRQAPNPYTPGQAWPPPVPAGQVPGQGSSDVWGPDPVGLASKDPQTVFVIELLCTGIFGLPGIGHLIVGETGWGLALLIGYPAVIWGGWTLITVFSCGFGAFLIPLQWPINFLVGYFLGHRVRQRVLDARAWLAQQRR